jgi:hypothetical protein
MHLILLVLLIVAAFGPFAVLRFVSGLGCIVCARSAGPVALWFLGSHAKRALTMNINKLLLIL